MESAPILEMASSPKKSERSGKKEIVLKGEKTQEQLREALRTRFGVLFSKTQEELSRYDEMCTDGSFDDKGGENAGSGEKRRQDAQSKISAGVDQAEKMKATLDSGIELPQSSPRIEATYAYTDPKKKKTETKEIVLDVEKKLQEFVEFYKDKGINLPATFEADILDIWQRNGDEIQEAIEKNGFDDFLLIPADMPLSDLSEKMKIGNGYYLSDNFKQGGEFAGAVSKNVDKPRIVLVHKTQNLQDSPELAKTLNIKGEDVDQKQILTLEDYLVFQNVYFKETGKHLDEIGWTWLATTSGARLVSSHWNPDGGKLNVYARDPDYHHENLGARPSRSFF
jgi:hypothetical protein